VSPDPKASGPALDLSAERTVLELFGPKARGLEKGRPTDLHPRTFDPGNAV